MTEYWQRSRVTGTKKGESGIPALMVTESVLHRRGTDPVVLACRRNHMMADCERISVETEEVFQEERYGLPVRRSKKDIPKDEARMELLDW